MGKIVLNAIDIYKSYTNGANRLNVLDKFSLPVMEGEIITIMGQSGSGKSTALNILGTLDKPDSGVLEINGVNIDNLNDNDISSLRNKDLGFIFQFHHLLPELTALENVMVPTWIKGDNNYETKAIELFQTLGLIDRVHHLPSQLSGGERSRVATIRAIINKPCVLFADEPTGNLDKKNSLKLIDLLGQINRDFSQSIVLTTHDPDVASIGDKQYKLENGSLIL